MPTTSDPILTPEFVERGYNNRAAVPEHPEWFAKYVELSAAARIATGTCSTCATAPRRCKRSISFFPRVRRGARSCSSTAGTGARSTSPITGSSPAPMVDQGIAVVVANYDLCPSVSIAKIVDECCRLMVWVAKEGPRHGAPADNVVVGGHSAGGHLAAMMFATDWGALGLPRDPFVAGMTLSGVHDLKPLVLSSYNADLRADQRRGSPCIAGQSRQPVAGAAAGRGRRC